MPAEVTTSSVAGIVLSQLCLMGSRLFCDLVGGTALGKWLLDASQAPFCTMTPCLEALYATEAWPAGRSNRSRDRVCQLSRPEATPPFPCHGLLKTDKRLSICSKAVGWIDGHTECAFRLSPSLGKFIRAYEILLRAGWLRSQNAADRFSWRRLLCRKPSISRRPKAPK